MPKCFYFPIVFPGNIEASYVPLICLLVYISGLKCYEEISGSVSTSIVLISIFNLLAPRAFPHNCRIPGQEALVKMVTDKLKMANLKEANTDMDAVQEAIENGLEYIMTIHKKYPLVCLTLELGSEWGEFVARCMDLHTDEIRPFTEKIRGRELQEKIRERELQVMKQPTVEKSIYGTGIYA